jgi:5-methylcytosine-specific restriction endonuclease McrA
MPTENPTPRPRSKRVYPPGHWSKYAKTKRAKRLAAGLCGGCGKPRGDNPVTCDGCLDRMRERGKRSRDVARAARPPKPPRDPNAYKRAWRARRRTAGLCTTCGGPRDTPNMVRCSACRTAEQAQHGEARRTKWKAVSAQASAELRTRRRAWKDAGLCSWCGGERDDPARRRCQECRARNNAAQKAQDRARRQAGLCPRCGGRPEGGERLCDRCREKQRGEYRRAFARDPVRFAARWHKRRLLIRENGGTFTQDDWEDIKARQDYRCPMCGKREPEIRLTIDHVIPVSLGGSNDPSNLGGLCGPCNLSKGARHIEYRDRPS